MLQQMAVQDKSVFLDYQNNGKATDLFNSGMIGMQVTGPWDLPSFPDVNYGVQIMPSFPGGTHESISGPDNWVLFNNGTARANAAWEFMKWFTAPQQVLQDSLTSGHLPTRESVTKMPQFAQLDKKFPGEGVFAENLANVKKARPVLTSYPQISDAMALAIVDIMSGKESDPQTALNEAADKANSALAIPQ
jgi:multiple sugar transport system substrate-binding protein